MSIKKIEVDGETLYVNKGFFFGWGVVDPIKNDDGTWNWKNLLGLNRRNLIFLIIIIMLAGIGYIGVQELVSSYKTIVDNPCSFCTDCQNQCRQVIYGMNIQSQSIKLNLNLS